MKKIEIIKILVFLLLTVSVLAGLSLGVVSGKTYLSGNEKMDKVVMEILREEENTIDVVILGDSLTYHSISPLDIWEKYGYSVYVCGSPAQTLDQSYDMLKMVLARHKPKIVLFEPNAFYRSIKNDSKTFDFMQRALPIFRHHNVWKNVAAGTLSVDDIKTIGYKGYRLKYKSNPAVIRDYMNEAAPDKQIDELNIKYFKKIKELCDENGIELTLMSVPSLKCWNSVKHDGVEKLADDLGIDYIDLNLNLELGIDWENDTIDKGDHLNYHGALKVTKYLGKYLSDKNVLKDHRQDSGFGLWHADLEKFKEKTK